MEVVQPALPDVNCNQLVYPTFAPNPPSDSLPRPSGYMTRTLIFLRQNSASLPIRTTYAHNLPSASGEVALQYWPRRDGATEPPSQLTFFILGELDSSSSS